MSVLNENQLLGASGAGEYEIEQSLRFNDDDGSYLSWTPASAGNRKTWTFSAWVKRTNLSLSGAAIFSAGVSGGARGIIDFNNTDTLRFGFNNESTWYIAETTAKFRDTSAWYHVLVKCDLANTTASIYVNNVIQATNSVSWPNADNVFNNNVFHAVGKTYVDGGLFDGYLAEINFIDGQALTPDSFGETGDYGEWKPIAYDGTYGTNGFYLPFEQDYTVEGFSTVTYEATQANQYIGGTGFQPDFIWFKNRTRSSPHRLVDAVRGLPNMLMTNTTGAEATAAADGTMVRTVTGFAPDGFTLGVDDGGYRVNSSTGDDIVAWSWDMGGTTASNTSGSITSSVRANTTYGQSIVSYTGNGTGGSTIGHGLASAPTMIIVKKRSDADDWKIYSETLGNTKALAFTTATPVVTSAYWNNTTPSTSVVTLGHGGHTNANGDTHIAYCFHDVANYSKFGSYSGNGSNTGTVVTTGFNPAFVMIKRSSSTGGWIMLDNTRSAGPNPINHKLQADDAGAEDVDTAWNISFLSNGFQLGSNHVWMNASGSTYIYAAFADTREYAYWYDQSGNNNDWTSEGGLTESDVMVDSPTNNFATFNPIHDDTTGTSTEVFSQGNLRVGESGTGWSNIFGSQGMPSGKWYWEAYMVGSGTVDCIIGIAKTNWHRGTDGGIDTAGAYSIYTASDGNLYSFNSGSSTNEGSGVAFTWGDILQVAYDADTGKLWFGKNNTWLFSGNPSTGSTPKMTVGASDTGNMLPAWSQYHAANAWAVNFGSDSSFSGVKTPQGNQDSNDIGDFFYAPPTGFLSLCTKSLPDVDVIPSEHFNPVIYTGTGSSNAISNLGLTPDFTWIKSRSNTEGHGLVDSVRGATKLLSSNTTDSEATSANYVASLDSDGFTVGTSTLTNGNGYTYVAWNWKSGGSASSNTNGSITSSVSANPAAGFSIVSYSGASNATTDNSNNGGAYWTIGHGLAKAPEVILVKTRSSAAAWYMGHQSLSATPWASGSHVVLNTTAANANEANILWGNTAPSSTVFTAGGWNVINRANSTYIAYCFHSVEGYSKVGSYTGNGSATDGTFVHCGFRPAYIFTKRTDSTGNWYTWDAARSTYNVMGERLVIDGTYVEEATPLGVDFLSNGFKWRGNNGGWNANGGTYIFLAFAETPSKFSNAR